MRNAITQSNVLQIHLKRPANGRLAVRVCAEPAHARTRAGGKALARFARSGAPDSLQKPTTRTQPTQPGKTCPRSLRSLGCSPFPPMPLQTLARFARSLPLRAPSITHSPFGRILRLHSKSAVLHFGRASFQAVAGRLKAAYTFLVGYRDVGDARSLRSLAATPRPLHYAKPVWPQPTAALQIGLATFRARFVSSGCRPPKGRLLISYRLPR